MLSSPDRKLRLIPAASTEYREAVRWYTDKSPNTALRFREQVGRTLDHVRLNPLQFPIEYRDARKALLDVFPYMVIFVLSGDIVMVLSITHTSRNSARWQYRLPPDERS